MSRENHSLGTLFHLLDDMQVEDGGKVKIADLPILWENIAIRINSIYRKILAKELDPVKIERLNSDFIFLKTARGDLFNLEENPIKHYLKIGEELKLNPFRKTCCMYYKLEEDVEGIGYCGNCPVKNHLGQ